MLSIQNVRTNEINEHSIVPKIILKYQLQENSIYKKILDKLHMLFNCKK